MIDLSRLMAQGRADNHPVAIRDGGVITFRQFKSDVADMAARFSACRRAALFCDDSYNFAVGLFGLLHVGATIIMPPNGLAETLESLRSDYDVLVDDAAVVQHRQQYRPLLALNPSSPQLVFMTSGSTGAPKKITKTLQMLECEIEVLEKLWGSSMGKGAVFATVSHQHIYGMTFKVLWPLMAGRPFTTAMYALWEDVFTALPPHAVLISSPAHLSRLEGLSALAADHQPKQIFSAGAPLSLNACQQTKAILGCYPDEIFGSTETGAIATRRQMTGNEPWRTLPGIKLQRSTEGQMRILSPFVGSEWVETSDLIETTPEGFCHLGRADRIAKIEGKRISLVAVEDQIAKLPGVKTVAVTVLPGHAPCLAAAVILNEDGNLTIGEIGEFRFSRQVRSQLTLSQEAAGIPRRWRFVKELPKHHMGKRRDADIHALFDAEAGKLPSILAADITKADEVTLQLSVTADDPAFAGHFPGDPILPGVVQIDWAVRFAKIHLGIGITGQNFQVKFRNIIRPDVPLTLTLQFKRAKNQLAFTYQSGDTIMSSGQFKLGDAA